MSRYTRLYLKGGIYFFTVVTHQCHPIFTDNKNIDLLKTAIKNVKQKHPFAINAIVILPDHLHCLWTLPEHDHDFSTRWRLIKLYFSRMITTPTNRRGEKEIWQRRYWEHAIRNDRDWRQHMDYIHYNPVKHGLATAPKEWKYSTFNYYVKQGIYKPDWGESESPTSIRFIRRGD